jgi:hypothetical protein
MFTRTSNINKKLENDEKNAKINDGVKVGKMNWKFDEGDIF